jgi:TonB family protein
MNLRSVCLTLAAATFALSVGQAAAQDNTAPRLIKDGLPAGIPQALGGGEVLLELTIDPNGVVQQVGRLRATPPYTELVADAIAAWQFEPATTVIDQRRTRITGSVLVAAVFRPPSLYAGPAPSQSPRDVAVPSPYGPYPEALVMPAYPPTAVGSGLVLVEITMTAGGEPRDFRLVSPVSGFDVAALDAVRKWRFRPARASEVPDRVFVYAVLGFRTPLAPPQPLR